MSICDFAVVVRFNFNIGKISVYAFFVGEKEF